MKQWIQAICCGTLLLAGSAALTLIVPGLEIIAFLIVLASALPFNFLFPRDPATEMFLSTKAFWGAIALDLLLCVLIAYLLLELLDPNSDMRSTMRAALRRPRSFLNDRSQPLP